MTAFNGIQTSIKKKLFSAERIDWQSGDFVLWNYSELAQTIVQIVQYDKFTKQSILKCTLTPNLWMLVESRMLCANENWILFFLSIEAFFSIHLLALYYLSKRGTCSDTIQLSVSFPINPIKSPTVLTVKVTCEIFCEWTNRHTHTLSMAQLTLHCFHRHHRLLIWHIVLGIVLFNLNSSKMCI